MMNCFDNCEAAFNNSKYYYQNIILSSSLLLISNPYYKSRSLYIYPILRIHSFLYIDLVIVYLSSENYKINFISFSD
jgi:hypothetical protein